MFARPDLQSRLILAISAFALEVCHLGWEYTHGGVPAHHLLNNPELPAISNWWGLLVVPLLVWFLVGRIQRRAATLVQTGSRERFRSSRRRVSRSHCCGERRWRWPSRWAIPPSPGFSSAPSPRPCSCTPGAPSLCSVSRSA